MKKIKIVLFVFMLTCITALGKVDAYSKTLGLTSVTVPAMQGIYTSPEVEKTTLSDQYIYKIGAIDKLSGDERAVGARLENITTYYNATSLNQYVKLPMGSTNLAQAPGIYKLQLKAEKWTATALWFSGTWYLDDYLIQ